jgi:undecaprenyl-diphosphatase
MSTHPRGAMTAILQSPIVRRFDQSADLLAKAGHGSPAIDRVLYTLSQAANHSMLWHSINAVDAITASPSRRRRALRRSAIIAIEQAAINGPIKLIAKRERPEEKENHPHQLRSPQTSSFPSGHASAAACAATLLSHDLGMAPLWWTLAAGVSWSRVHVGVHHASDVAAGLIAGRTIARTAQRFWPSRS